MKSGDGLDKLNSHFLNIKKSMYIIQIFDKSRNSAVNVSTRNTLRRTFEESDCGKWVWGTKRNWSPIAFQYNLNYSFHLLSCTYTVWITAFLKFGSLWNYLLFDLKDPKQLSCKPPEASTEKACMDTVEQCYNRTFRKWQSSPALIC